MDCHEFTLPPLWQGEKCLGSEVGVILLQFKDAHYANLTPRPGTSENGGNPLSPSLPSEYGVPATMCSGSAPITSPPGGFGRKRP